MVEVYETGMENKIMVYVPTNESKWTQKLRWYRKEAAVYFDNKRRISGRHWLLRMATVKKLGLSRQIIQLTPE